MAPEQMEGPTAWISSQTYSLGVVSLQMLTANSPSAAASLPSTASRSMFVGRGGAADARRDPERRYPRASDVKTDIESIASATSGGGQWSCRKCRAGAKPASVTPVRQRMSIVPFGAFRWHRRPAVRHLRIAFWRFASSDRDGQFCDLVSHLCVLMNLPGGGGAGRSCGRAGGLVAQYRVAGAARRLGNLGSDRARGCWVYPRDMVAVGHTV